MKKIILAIFLFTFPAFAQQPDEVMVALNRLKASHTEASAVWRAEHFESSMADFLSCEVPGQITAETVKQNDPFTDQKNFAIAVNAKLQQVIDWQTANNNRLNSRVDAVETRIDSMPTKPTIVREYLPAPIPYTPPPTQPYVDPRIQKARDGRDAAGPDSK